MHESLESLAKELESIAEAVAAGFSEDRPFNKVWGWNFPALTRHDLARAATRIADQIRSHPVEELDEKTINAVNEATSSVASCQATTIKPGYIYNGNGAGAVPAYLSTLAGVRDAIEPLYGWDRLEDRDAMPKRIANRLRGLRSDIEKLVPDYNVLAKQVSEIRDAHETAESLPADLATLAEARTKIAESEKVASFSSLKGTPINSARSSQRQATVTRCE